MTAPNGAVARSLARGNQVNESESLEEAKILAAARGYAPSQHPWLNRSIP